MSGLFLSIVNMSISACYIVLAVLLLRLLLKKAPKWITVALWGIVAVRLVCPFSIESVLSLIPSAETVSPSIMTDQTPAINSGIPIINNVINPIIGESFTPAPGVSANPLQIWIPILTAIWIVGIVAMLIYTVISFARVRRKIGTAVILRGNIYQSENVVSPFVLGIIKPKIYLPFGMNEKNMGHVIAHEMAHISRKDHLWKPLGFLLLTLHWFNPLMWLGYVLLCRDIELACDEKVIKGLDCDAKADYSEALLTCSVSRRMIAACPLAFGEVGVKNRIKSVLNYKKPAFWIILVATLACIALTVCFLTNPINENNIGIKGISAEKIDHNTVGLTIGYSYPTGGYSVRLVDKAEGEYCGDGIKDYDGSLGEYRILIEFGDTKPSKEFMEKYPVGETIELENSPIRIRIKRVHPQDHGFFLYVGFDSPIAIDKVENGKLKTFGGTVYIPVTLFPKDQIYSFFPPDSDSDKLSYIYIQDYGHNSKDVIIDFRQVRFENEEIIFDIYWRNDSDATIDIGPNFEIYKYDKDKPIKLEPMGVWHLNLLILSRKDAGLINEKTVSYNVSYHYNVFEPGKYRFEAHGAWVEFQIIDNFSEISLEYDRATFDIDGDGVEENCSMRVGTTSGLFTFVFLVQNKDTGEVEYENTIYSDVYNLSFEKGDDGITRVKAVTKGETPRTHLFDISIVNGIINLTENGVPIGDIASNDTSVSDIIDQLDAACKEQLVWTDGDYAGSQYEGIICYLCKADAGHVFIASIQWKGPTWTGPGSMTLGDYFFGGYTGVSRNKAIYIYDGEKVTNIISAYNSGLLSDKDLDLVYRKWVESSVISAYENDLSQKYELLGIEAITETGKIIAYAVKVLVKDSAWNSEGSTLKVGNYEFRSYGKNAFIYVYNKADFGGNGAQPLDFMYDHYKDKIESELATIYSYWQANLVDN